ncbi:MAG: TlpA disulfide reductase family protein [Candidatus Caldarchaeum sp.]|nr:TlpA family protein disulfide reductase [Candidatus Caldarchaeum sp.]MDW8063172.1 TlpA disulfide reductase family protein [Candidatus Caldarchaeum sp.]MDW8435560.1 TlpA disulfide reductase family protein [Candidatus Caldarchaeum sp.]
MPKKKQKTTRSLNLYLALIPAAMLVAFIIYLVVTPPAANLGTTQNTSIQPPARTGESAKPFTLNLIDGNGLKNEKLSFNPTAGEVVLLDFVHEWCRFCREMAPIMEKLHDEYSGKGVIFVTVAGGYNTNPAKTAEFIRNYGLSWPVVYDSNLDVFKAYGVQGTPTYFLITKDGKIATKLEGAQTYQTLAQQLEILLQQ